MGLMLVQVVNGVEQVISNFLGKLNDDFLGKLNDAQLKYSVREHELLAVHEACQFFTTLSTAVIF